MASQCTLCYNKGPFFSIQMRQPRAQKHKGNRTTKHNEMCYKIFSKRSRSACKLGIGVQ